MFRSARVPLLALALALLPGPAVATVIHGESEAFGILIDLETFGPDIAIGPAPSVAGTAPAPYALTDDLLAISIGGVDLALLEVAASSDVDGASGIRFASASAGFSDLSITFGGILSLEITGITASADATGDFGALVAAATSGVLDASLEVFGSSIFEMDLDLPANSVVFDAFGIEIVVNEQIFTGDGVGEAAVSVNAVHITVDNFLAGGEIILSHAEARLLAVPEPRATGLLMLGVLLVLARARRERGARQRRS